LGAHLRPKLDKDYGCQQAQHKVIIKENEIVANEYKSIAF
jgi:hypothetical protein